MKKKIEDKRSKIIDFTASVVEMEEYMRGNYVDSFASLVEVIILFIMRII